MSPRLKLLGSKLDSRWSWKLLYFNLGVRANFMIAAIGMFAVIYIFRFNAYMGEGNFLELKLYYIVTIIIIFIIIFRKLKRDL